MRRNIGDGLRGPLVQAFHFAVGYDARGVGNLGYLMFRQLRDHPLAAVCDWAQQQIDGLQHIIAEERKRDEEDPVRFD